MFVFIVMQSREKQVQRIRNLFHRQLSVPLADLCSTLLTYKTWEAEQGANLDVESSNFDGLSPQVASSYQKALDMLNARTHLENQISDKVAPESERLQQFMVHILILSSISYQVETGLKIDYLTMVVICLGDLHYMKMVPACMKT